VDATPRTSFAYSDRERDALIEAGQAEGKKLPKDNPIQRYKGLGEMDYRGAVGDHDGSRQRTLLQVTLDDAAAADEIFSILMGEDVESAPQLHPAQRARRALPRHLSFAGLGDTDGSPTRRAERTPERTPEMHRA
jgi:DNA gyrase/topoisomerase IV subunit B